MQVRIGSGGSRPVGMRFGGGTVRSVAESMARPENWLIDAVLLILVVIVIVLIVLIAREFYLQKKKK